MEHLLTQDHYLNAEKIAKKLDKLEKAHTRWSKLFGAMPTTLSYSNTEFDILPSLIFTCNGAWIAVKNPNRPHQP
ncbi:MAG: hypothetical protein ACTSRK_20220 [Promethearchaeota archaeon]